MSLEEETRCPTRKWLRDMNAIPLNGNPDACRVCAGDKSLEGCPVAQAIAENQQRTVNTGLTPDDEPYAF